MFSKHSWIRRWFSSKAHPVSKRANRTRLCVEALEDRFAPSVNHAPVSMDNYALTNEDTPVVLTSAYFFFTDPNDNPANNFQAVRIASLPGAGMLSNNGAPAAVGSYVSVADLNLGKLVFTPALNANGTPYTTFGFQVQDDGGTEGGGADTSAVQTMNFNVNAVNDAPSFTAANPPATDMTVDQIEIPGWVTSFSPGSGADEASQTASYFVSNISNPFLFSSMPTVSPNGTLTYTLGLYAYGASTFDVWVQDNGGTANGGQDTSLVSTFTAQVNQRVSFTVNTTNDTPDAQVGNGVARDMAGFTSLRAAVTEGNAAPAGTIVSVNFAAGGQGTINLGITLDALNRNFRISGPGFNQLTVQRLAGAGNFRVFTINGGTEVVIRDLTIANGNVVGLDNLGNGGGILNAGSLELYGAVLENNTASRPAGAPTGGLGGAIANSIDALLLVFNCDLHYNTAFNGGAIANAGLVTIDSATMIYVNTAGQDGGGVYNYATGQVNITGGSQIYSNTATFDGGGIMNYGTLTGQMFVLYDNNAGRYGGGLAVWDGSVNLTDVTFQQNRAGVTINTGKGGGFYIRRGTVTLTTPIITGNICTPNPTFAGAGWAANFPPTLVGGSINDPMNPDPNPPA